MAGTADPNDCDNNPTETHLDDLAACIGACSDVCAEEPPEGQCNPVTARGCESGASCDVSVSETYICYPPPNEAALCDVCDNETGPFCGPGLTCVTDVTMSGGFLCARYCCSNADCGSGVCTWELGFPHGIGVCADADEPDWPACDAPETAFSWGSCYTP